MIRQKKKTSDIFFFFIYGLSRRMRKENSYQLKENIMYVDMFVKIKLKLNNLKKKKIISSIGLFFPLTFADDLCQRRRIQFRNYFVLYTILFLTVLNVCALLTMRVK
jgi:hypothetical protein